MDPEVPEYAIEVEVGNTSKAEDTAEVTTTAKWPFGLHKENVEPLVDILNSHPELQVTM